MAWRQAWLLGPITKWDGLGQVLTRPSRAHEHTHKMVHFSCISTSSLSLVFCTLYLLFFEWNLSCLTGTIVTGAMFEQVLYTNQKFFLVSEDFNRVKWWKTRNWITMFFNYERFQHSIMFFNYAILTFWSGVNVMRKIVRGLSIIKALIENF